MISLNKVTLNASAPHHGFGRAKMRDKKKSPDFDWFLQRLKSEKPDLSVKEKIVREAAEIIWSKLQCSLDVNSIVSELPTTRRTLERHFMEQLGLTIREVVAFARLELVKWLLTETSLPIHEVAKQAGYASSDWMGKVIRRKTGMTPGDYRLSSRTSN